MAVSAAVSAGTSALFGEKTSGKSETARKIAKGLGWLSIGLGVSEIVAPGKVTRLIGVPRGAGASRVMGVRKVAAGLGLLMTPGQTAGLLTRLGGNAIEWSRLRDGRRSNDSHRGRAAATMAAVAGVTVLDAWIASKLISSRRPVPDRVILHSSSVAVNKTPEECYLYWHDLEKLPLFFRHIKAVRPADSGHTEWVAKGPDGQDISWLMEITEDVRSERIAWCSIATNQIMHSGWVRFEPIGANKGTIVRVHMQYEVPEAMLRWNLSRFFGSDPGMRLRKSLMRFKQLLETGEIATTEGQSSGRAEGVTWLDRTARI